MNVTTSAGLWSRRRFAGSLAAAVAGAAGLSAPDGALPAFADGEPEPAPLLPSLRPLPAHAAPFDAAGRHALAADALTYFVRQQGLFPGRGVHLLPAAPWFGGHETLAWRRSWDMSLPAGLPLYLLADARPDGRLDPAATTVTVDGVALTDLDRYVHHGVRALSGGTPSDHAVLDLVFAPPAAGRYRLEVRTQLDPGSSDSLDETVLLYDITVQPADALGALLLRDAGGSVYATVGSERRLVPDEETLGALGVPASAIVPASDGVLDALTEGPPLPPLRDGMLVRAESHPSVFRLSQGRRVWLKGQAGGQGDGGGAEVVTVDAPVLHAIPPVLQEGMLLKGAALDVYHVDRGALRKIPDWNWAAELGLRPADVLYVPERVIAALPQNSPHWVVPGGTWEDRFFDSSTLGRQMPYRVYLPPSYHAPDRAGRRYPVIYLLHGMGGRYDEWSGYGVEEVANQLLPEGTFAHCIIVMPQGGLGYWMDQVDGIPWASYVARDLVEHVDAAFRTIPRREARAVGGLSMGAHGAMQLALNFSEVFGVAGVHSPSIRTQATAPAYFGSEADFARRDPVSLVRDSRLDSPPRIWIDAGVDDQWRWSAEALHRALVEKGWEHEWHVLAGEHDGWYWGDQIWRYLPFYADSFEQLGVPLVR